ncbi:MAG: hypothetical protein IJK26_10105 [Clostridia bacterium]|nr:hypothetical protein [Clostridia bacterium]
MKLTKKVEAMIDRRTRLAQELMEACCEVDDFIKDNGLEDEVENCDWLTGVEIYCNPAASGERIKEAIRNHKG